MTTTHTLRKSGDDLPREGQIIFDLELSVNGWPRIAPWGYRTGDQIWAPATINSRWELHPVPATCLVSYLKPDYTAPEWVDLEHVAYFLAHLDQDDWWVRSERDIPPGVRRASSRHRDMQVPLWPVREQSA